MLQNLRDNLKGAVAVVVIVIFVVPLVLFGVEQMFVGSAGGSDVASVNGEGISNINFQRELNFEKNRLAQQRGLAADSPQLEDSVLRGPVIDRMVRKEALLQAAREGGMGASKDALWRQISQMEAFQIDGKFDQALFKERISYWFTPATFLEENAKDFILDQLIGGVRQSAFVTDVEMQVMASIAEQKRGFYQLNIARGEAEDVEVTEPEMREYYESNSAQFVEPESVVVNYIELNLDDMAKQVTVSDDEIKAVYDQELSEFNAEPKYQVAHILIETEEGREEKLAEISAKLEQGTEFSDLAKEYSEDLGSKDAGGSLGVMVEDGFPEEFVAAVKELQVGEVSAPVTTDAGVHIIKLVDLEGVEPPSFEDRKDNIKKQLARQKAQEEFVTKAAQLDESTFGADNLTFAAEELGLEVKQSESFTRRGGSGIAASQQVVDAAYAEDVLEQGHNSAVLNLEGDRSIVLRLEKHQPELLKPFDTVKTQIERRLVQQKLDSELQEKADEIIAQLAGGEDPQQLAEQQELTYTSYETAGRSESEADPSVLRKVFSLPRPNYTGEPVFDRAVLPGTGVAVIALREVVDGKLSELEQDQVENTRRQMAFQSNAAELTALQAAIIESADIEKPGE